MEATLLDGDSNEFELKRIPSAEGKIYFRPSPLDDLPEVRLFSPKQQLSKLVIFNVRF